MKKYIDLIKKSYLFHNFSDEAIEELLNNNLCNIAKYKKNSIIHLQGDECKYCDIILSGNVSIQDIDSNGNVLTINEFEVGDVFGENLLFSNFNSYPMTIISKTDTEVLHLKKELIVSFCQSNIDFLNIFLKSISSKTVILKDKVKRLSMKSIRSSIVDFLIYQNHHQNSKVIKLYKTKKEIAEEFGIQRSSFSRELNKMKKDGLIDFDSKSITIVDMDSLLNQHS